jgi:acyl-CoA dehydrogenase
VIGQIGDGFRLSQMRLGPARIQHCMRWLGQCRLAFELLCQRSTERFVHGSTLSEKQAVRHWIADCHAEIAMARLLVLQTAWKIDAEGTQAARADISMIKVFVPKVLHNVLDKAIQAHGALGISSDTPLERMYRAARATRIFDGPDEVHRDLVAREILRERGLNGATAAAAAK